MTERETVIDLFRRYVYEENSDLDLEYTLKRKLERLNLNIFEDGPDYAFATFVLDTLNEGVYSCYSVHLMRIEGLYAPISFCKEDNIENVIKSNQLNSSTFCYFYNVYRNIDGKSEVAMDLEIIRNKQKPVVEYRISGDMFDIDSDGQWTHFNFQISPIDILSPNYLKIFARNITTFSFHYLMNVFMKEHSNTNLFRDDVSQIFIDSCNQLK